MTHLHDWHQQVEAPKVSYARVTLGLANRKVMDGRDFQFAQSGLVRYLQRAFWERVTPLH